jgi:hypothetical protein
MIARIKANQSLRKRSSCFNTRQVSFHKSGEPKLSFRHATEEELEVIRKKNKNNRRQDTQKAILTLILSVILTIGLIWLMVILN